MKAAMNNRVALSVAARRRSAAHLPTEGGNDFVLSGRAPAMGLEHES